MLGINLMNIAAVQVKSAEDMEDESKEFLPEMCHQIYGDNENIFGYRGLKISLYMSAASLRSYVAVSHEDKVKLRTLDMFDTMRTLDKVDIMRTPN